MDGPHASTNKRSVCILAFNQKQYQRGINIAKLCCHWLIIPLGCRAPALKPNYFHKPYLLTLQVWSQILHPCVST